MDKLEELLGRFPPDVRVDLSRVPTALWQEGEELRLRTGYPAVLISGGREYTLSGQTLGNLNKNILNNIINRFLNYSDYAYPQELSGGFIPLPGGHRAGFCGQAVVENGRIVTIRDVSSINLRLARDVPGIGDALWLQLLDPGGRFGNTLIASPPGCGKTTLLRSLIHTLSNNGYHVSVCDERGEVAGAGAEGFAFDLGKRTDVMTGCSKEEGMIAMLRSMRPQVLATDEIGTSAEVQVLLRAISAGVTLLTTVHASDLRDVLIGPLEGMVKAQLFSRIVFLTDQPRRGTVTGVWRRELLNSEVN